MRQITILWVLLTLLAAATGAVAFQIQGVQHHQNDAIRSIMCFAEQRVAESPQLSAKQKRQATRFYDAAIAQAHLKPCQGGSK